MKNLHNKITDFLLKTAEQGLEPAPEEVLAEAKALLVEAQNIIEVRNLPPVDDGYPAFPESCTAEGHPSNVYSGISRRDYFASKAMQGICSNTGTYGINNGPDSTAKRAYEVADAMLIARLPNPPRGE